MASSCGRCAASSGSAPRARSCRPRARSGRARACGRRAWAPPRAARATASRTQNSSSGAALTSARSSQLVEEPRHRALHALPAGDPLPARLHQARPAGRPRRWARSRTSEAPFMRSTIRASASCLEHLRARRSGRTSSAQAPGSTLRLRGAGRARVHRRHPPGARGRRRARSGSGSAPTGRRACRKPFSHTTRVPVGRNSASPERSAKHASHAHTSCAPPAGAGGGAPRAFAARTGRRSPPAAAGPSGISRVCEAAQRRDHLGLCRVARASSARSRRQRHPGLAAVARAAAPASSCSRSSSSERPARGR